MEALCKWILENVLLGCLATLSISLILLIIGWFAKEFIPSLIRKITYIGPDISGSWRSDFKINGLEGYEDIVLKQNGHKIKGEIHSVITQTDKSTYSLNSVLIGEFRDEYLVAYYTPKEKGRFGCGSYTFKLVERGKVFEGICPFQYTATREIKILKYKWRRK